MLNWNSNKIPDWFVLGVQVYILFLKQFRTLHTLDTEAQTPCKRDRPQRSWWGSTRDGSPRTWRCSTSDVGQDVRLAEGCGRRRGRWTHPRRLQWPWGEDAPYRKAKNAQINFLPTNCFFFVTNTKNTPLVSPKHWSHKIPDFKSLSVLLLLFCNTLSKTSKHLNIKICYTPRLLCP